MTGDRQRSLLRRLSAAMPEVLRGLIGMVDPKDFVQTAPKKRTGGDNAGQA
jgi:hypothetical protein